LIFGLIATGGDGGHGAAGFVVSGIFVGVSGGLAMGVYAHRLKMRRTLLTTKGSNQITLVAGVPACMFLAYMSVTGGQWSDLLAWVYLSALYLAMAASLSFSTRLIANWDLRKTAI
jgi:hypothetical protein